MFKALDVRNSEKEIVIVGVDSVCSKRHALSVLQDADGWYAIYSKTKISKYDLAKIRAFYHGFCLAMNIS